MKRDTYINLAGFALVLALAWWLLSKWAALAYLLGAAWGLWDAKRRGGEAFTCAVAWPVRLAIIVTEHLVARGIPGAGLARTVVAFVADYFESLRRTPK